MRHHLADVSRQIATIRCHRVLSKQICPRSCLSHYTSVRLKVPSLPRKRKTMRDLSFVFLLIGTAAAGVPKPDISVRLGTRGDVSMDHVVFVYVAVTDKRTTTPASWVIGDVPNISATISEYCFPFFLLQIGLNVGHDTATAGTLGGVTPRVKWQTEETSVAGFDVQVSVCPWEIISCGDRRRRQPKMGNDGPDIHSLVDESTASLLHSGRSIHPTPAVVVIKHRCAATLMLILRQASM
jgi:hypothetical protein